MASRLSADKDSSGLLSMAVVWRKSCFNARRGRAAPCLEACSAGLADGFQVGLWRPAEGDLVGLAAA